jgi:hypothetical protein
MITAKDPFRVAIGGSNGMSVPIPAATRFLLALNGSSNLVAGFRPTASSTISITPSGDGFIAMTLEFHGQVEGKDVDVLVSTAADTPLVNRPPVANAGPDISVQASNCKLFVPLNANSSYDVDGNLSQVRWLESGTYQAGLGATPNVRIWSPGVTTFTAVVTDSFGAKSRDDVRVNATFPAGCFP